jgi:CheY-like chemotaxis protein
MGKQVTVQMPQGGDLTAPGLLVVDPDPGTRRLLREFLDGAGFVTDEAPDVGAALARLATWEPAAIVLHDGLSGRQGLEIVRLLRAERPALPVVFSASVAASGARARARRRRPRRRPRPGIPPAGAAAFPQPDRA